MFRRAITGAIQPWRLMFSRLSSSDSPTLLCSLRDHYYQVSKRATTPKEGPPFPFVVAKEALDRNGPILKREFGDEEISLRVLQFANFTSVGEDDGDDSNQLFLHVDISKPGQKDSLHFLCGLYPDALGILSVSLRQNLESSGFLVVPTKYDGPVFQVLDEHVKNALHNYIEERGINKSLFPFLQAFGTAKHDLNLLSFGLKIFLNTKEDRTKELAEKITMAKNCMFIFGNPDGETQIEIQMSLWRLLIGIGRAARTSSLIKSTPHTFTSHHQ